MNGTLLEPISVMQILLASLAVLYFSYLGEAVKARRAVFFFFAALLAFLVMLVAPGTAIRMGKIATIAFLPRFFRTLGIAVKIGRAHV